MIMPSDSLLDHSSSNQHWLLKEPPTLPSHRSPQPPRSPQGKFDRGLFKYIPLLSSPVTARFSTRRILLFILATTCLYLTTFVYPSQVQQWKLAGASLLGAHDTVACSATVTTDNPRLSQSKLFRFSDWNTPYGDHYVSLYPRLLLHNRHSLENEEPTEIPLECLENHIAFGIPCRNPSSTHTSTREKLDVVWTYVNGSDPLHKDTYLENLATLKASRPKMFVPPPKKGTFREYDELRFSLRSLVAGLRYSAAKLFLVTSDFPYPGCNGTSPWRVGQIPQWLPRDPIQSGETWKDGDLSLHVVHHSSMFPPMGNKSIFNSLAIESRLHHLDGLSNYFIYMNDDVFINSNLSIYDFYSRDFGPVFRMQPDLLVGGTAVRTGEWVALQYSNQLLDARFGTRSRPYLAHLSKTMGVPFLREIHTIWPEPLLQTASHSFRALSVQFNPDVSTTFLMTHYVLERWREMLLWSFIVGSIGGDRDEWDVKKAWKSLSEDEGSGEVEVVRGIRRTLQRMNESVFDANFEGRKGKTEYLYTSLDGSPYAGLYKRGFRDFPDFSEAQANSSRYIATGHGKIASPRIHPGATCSLSRDKCFNLPDNVHQKASEVFKHVAFRRIECGDCIIQALLNQSGETGLAAILPPSSRKFPTKSRPFIGSREIIPRLPLTHDWTTTDFSLLSIPTTNLSVRSWVAQALLRYRFVIGATASTFVQLETVSNTQRHLKAIDKMRGQPNEPAIICLNDDIAFSEKVVRVNLIRWLSDRWPHRAQWEES